MGHDIHWCVNDEFAKMVVFPLHARLSFIVEVSCCKLETLLVYFLFTLILFWDEFVDLAS